MVASRIPCPSALHPQATRGAGPVALSYTGGHEGFQGWITADRRVPSWPVPASRPFRRSAPREGAELGPIALSIPIFEELGRSVRDVVPEAQGQGFFELLDDVYASGVAHVGRNMLLRLRSASGAADR